MPNEQGSKGESEYAVTPSAGSYQISTGLDWYSARWEKGSPWSWSHSTGWSRWHDFSIPSVLGTEKTGHIVQLYNREADKKKNITCAGQNVTFLFINSLMWYFRSITWGTDFHSANSMVQFYFKICMQESQNVTDVSQVTVTYGNSVSKISSLNDSQHLRCTR